MRLTRWYKWAYSKQGDGTSVLRRYRYQGDKRIWETYPKAKYAGFTDDQIEALLRRLNTSHEAEEAAAKARYQYDHAYVNTQIMADFETHLNTKSTSQDYIRDVIHALNDYVLDYFIQKVKMPDPNHWRQYEESYGQFLLKANLSPGYVTKIIHTANRFVRFLNKKYPDEVALYKLDPVSQNVLKRTKARENEYENLKAKYITKDEYERICQVVDTRLLPNVKLGYHYGLRRAETLGLTVDDIYETELSVERQLVSVGGLSPVTDILKGIDRRTVPHWNCMPDEAFEWINSIELMHPDTLSKRWEKSIKEEAGLDFDFHDLRHTFITNALQQHHYTDVRLAAGHKQLATTERYIQDHRKMSRKRFNPSIRIAKD
jgi:integrase